MLKIKDNVDLKELEKFGLKPMYALKNSNTGETTIDYLYSMKYENSVGFFRLIPRKAKKYYGFIGLVKILKIMLGLYH